MRPIDLVGHLVSTSGSAAGCAGSLSAVWYQVSGDKQWVCGGEFLAFFPLLQYDCWEIYSQCRPGGKSQSQDSDYSSLLSSQ
jgi:hypothetical protein